MLRVRQLVILLTVLMLILGALLAVYFFIINPPVKTADVKGLRHVFSIYGWGSRPDQLLKRPHGVAVDTDKNIYVTDGSGKIVVFDRDGNYLRSFGGFGKKPGSLRGALGIAIDQKSNRVYIADRVRFRLVIYTTKGKFIKEVPVLSPVTPMVYGNKVFLATYGPILVYNLNGVLLDSWGDRGRKAGQFDYPHGLVADKQGNIYVADTNNARLVVMNKRGEPIASKGLPTKGVEQMEAPAEFALPAGLAMDDKNRLFMVDAFDFSIKAYNLRGQQIAVFGGNPGQMEGEFSYPDGIAFLGDRTFAIADKFNDRIQVVRLTIPGEETLGDRIPRWAYLLLLIPLLLLLSLFGRKRVIANEDFLEQIVAQKKVRLLAVAYKRVFVTQDIFDKFMNIQEEGFEITDLLAPRSFNQKKADQIKEAYSLNNLEATYLACAMKTLPETIFFARNMALVDNERLRELAEGNKLKTQSYEEFIDQYEIEAALTEEEKVLEESEPESERVDTDATEKSSDSEHDKDIDLEF